MRVACWQSLFVCTTQHQCLTNKKFIFLTFTTRTTLEVTTTLLSLPYAMQLTTSKTRPMIGGWLPLETMNQSFRLASLPSSSKKKRWCRNLNLVLSPLNIRSGDVIKGRHVMKRIRPSDWFPLRDDRQLIGACTMNV